MSFDLHIFIMILIGIIFNHKQIGLPHSNFCRPVKGRERQRETYSKIVFRKNLHFSCAVSSSGCCYFVGSFDYHLIERFGPTIPNPTLVPSWRCQRSLFTGKCVATQKLCLCAHCTQKFIIFVCVCV